MKRFLLMVGLLMSSLFAMSQAVTVRFTGVNLGGSYCPLDSVVVTNLSRGWMETLVYPDTTLFLSGLGVEEVVPSCLGITNVYPNPSSDFANVVFGIAEAGQVRIGVVGIDGVQKTSWEGYLQSGTHRVGISLDKPQMALVVIDTEKERYVDRLIQIDNGSGNTIKLSDEAVDMPQPVDRAIRSDRLDAYGGFEPGDFLSFTGMWSSIVSETVTKDVYEDETITLMLPLSPLPPVGTVYTIGDILQMESGTVFHEDASVYGIVTADEMSGNLYKTIFIQDRATGDAIELYMNTVSAARIGDSIRVSLKDATYSLYHGLPQLSNINPDGQLFILAMNQPIEPIETTIADIVAGNHLAGLVKLSNVMFVERNTFADPNNFGNRTLVDPTDYSHMVVVRTSNYANFANDSLPQGLGSLVAIASVYRDTWQLILRSASELEFNGIIPGGDLDLPYYQDFISSFGTYSTYDVMGPQSWEIAYNTAKMTGYENSTNNANEDWLISAPVSLEGVTEVTMTIKYIARYFSNLNQEVTIQVSTDYTSGDPNQARWIQVPALLVEGSGWSEFITADIDLSQFAGQKVVVAIKYVSTEVKAGTIEVQSILIQEGGVTPTPPPTPGPGSGSGTADDPYNVASGIALQDEEPIAWVQGYIVGAVKSGVTSVSSNSDVNWNTPFDSQTNVLIADDPDCQDVALCIIVNLPANKPLRTQVNLKDNPDNLGKTLAVNGKLRKYFGQAGLRDSGGTESDFMLDGMYPTPPAPGNEIFSETFASNQGGFVIQDVVLPSELSYVWTHSAQYSCMKASAYVGQNYEAESWLVSPAIDLSDVSTASLSFEQAVNYASPTGMLFVMISTDYEDDVTTATWEELVLSAWPAGNNWTFISSIADLTPYVGQTVNIAFKYTSTNSASATWEVKNVVVE